MRCGICGRTDAVIRTIEKDVALISHKVYVDCQGHSQYRHVSIKELTEESVREEDV